MPWDDNLVGAALDVARAPADTLRVMAGPGTGKSYCMKRRVARLIEEDEVEPRRILAVTFTRNAAASLIEDLHDLGVEGCEQIKASTLHAFCFGLLSSAAVFEYLGRVPRPLVVIQKVGVLYFEGAPLLADTLAVGFGPKRDCTKRITAFEAAWARLQSDAPGWPTDQTDRLFHTALVGWLKFHKSMLIGELVPEAHRFLRNNPANQVFFRFDHIIVDEYQDLNRAEQVLIDILCANSCIAIVGDVDQSIYRFRHAHPEGITEFDDHHPDTHDESLVECRRCPRNVVTIADHLILQNHPPDEPARLSPLDGNPDGEIHIVQWNSLDGEWNRIAQYIEFLTNNAGYDPGDIIVLSPRRHLGYGMRNAIENLGIAAHSFYHEEPLEAEKAQKSFALLTLLNNPEDRVALRWWLGYGSPTWRSGQYKNLRDCCHDTEMSPRELLLEMSAGEIELARTNQLVARFQELENDIAALDGLSCEELVQILFPDEREWAKPMNEVAQIVLERMQDDDPANLLDGLRTNITQPEMPEEGDFVRVMSLHKSKGLTSKVVIVTGCMHGLIPSLDRSLQGAKREAALNEQRRLFYVAITRCREVLVLSSVVRLDTALAYKIGAPLRAPPRRQGVWPTIASPFIDELGPTAPDAVNGEDWIAGGFA